MSQLTSFRELEVWRRAMDVAQECYQCSRTFTLDDQIALGHQIRRSAVSVPSNIAEGFGRHHTAEYVHFLRIAKGSNNELQTQLELAGRTGVLATDVTTRLRTKSEIVGRMLHRLIDALRRI